MNTCVKYLENTAIKFPKKKAIVHGEKQISFSDLRKNSLSITSLIDEKIQNQPIAIFLPKSIAAIECYLASLYSGNFYVPLDVKSPIERIKKVIIDLEPALIFTNSQLLPLLLSNPAISTFKIINIDEIIISQIEPPKRSLKIIDTDPIYCLYTSGSTGSPKGVVLSHKAVDDFISWAEKTYNITEQTIIGNQAPFLFDVSVMDIYLSLKTGATMHIIPELFFSFPYKLIHYLQNNLISHIIWVPSVLISVANSGVLNDIPLPHLKNILFAGEVMPNKQLNIWRKKIPNALFSNLYGPTEAAVIATYYIVEREFKDDESLPIGFPCDNMNVLLLTDDKRRAQKNEIGELLIKGTGLAIGYYKDNDKTKESFIQNPFNKKYIEIFYRTGDLVKYNDLGELIFVGRKGSQIKHSGYRIELGEIDNAAMSMEGILNVCAIYDEIKKQIILFYQSDSTIEDISIRTHLLTMLPKYMMPEKYFKLDVFPYNSNGKIDRRKIKSKLLSTM